MGQVASRAGTWQSGSMTTPTPTRTPMAGGFLIGAAVLVGTAIGLVYGQPSAGFVIGAATGVALAVVVWLKDRAR